ncbi:hypothetical protein [Geminicoccus flavidas]|uniref:hypothetical protein n=1 Tax=Geminicoccus flavidas TaxID=2506407 RepID=UPI00135C4546|nr:hypothetical protein [Geminicoccus flavidas]
MSLHQFKKIALASALLSSAIATDSLAQGQRAAQAPDSIVATLELDDGSTVQFLEPTPGLIAIHADVPLAGKKGAQPGFINGVSVEQLESLSSVEQYRLLSKGQAVPATLAQAQQRIAQVRAMQPRAGSPPAVSIPAGDGKAKSSRALTGATEAMSTRALVADTGSWFNSNYCAKSGFTYSYCWLYRTGDGYVQRRSNWIRSIAYPYRGNVQHKLEYETCTLFWCRWNTFLSATVLQGHWNWQSANGNFNYKASLYEAAGDGWHFSVYGG